MPDDHLTIARRYIESVQGKNDMAAADELVAADLKYFSALAPTGYSEERGAFKEAIAEY